ncbi:MAG TPA: uL22 family ribosomal protein [archaeon]|nr:uL22 family ribosomal protein [archaeon]
MKTATAKLVGAKISSEKSRVILDDIRNGSLTRAKKLLNDLLDNQVTMKGKRYTKTADVLLGFLESAEANAKQKNLNSDKLFIKKITADKGEKNFRGRSRYRLRGRVAKSTNLEVILEER